MPGDEDAYIEITHTNNAEADKAFASYWTLVSEEYDFLEGDVLEYDVVVSRKIKGIGGMEIQMSDNAWGENMRDCLDLFDNNGIQVHPNKFAVQEANKWQHRTIQIPAKLLDAGNGGAAPMDLMYAVDLTDEMLAPGETITVRLANIRITNGGEVRDTFFDKDNDIDVSDLKVEAGAADPEVATTFKTVGAKAPEDPDEPVIPDVPEDEQLVKIDGVKDSRYSEYNSIDIVDAYADGGVDPEQNFDDVTGKLYYTWDDNYIYFYVTVKDSEIKEYVPLDPYPTDEAGIAAEELRRVTFDCFEMYLDPDPTINPNDHFDVNCKDKNCAEMRFAVGGYNLDVFNASEKNERIYDEEYCVPFKTDDGYGFEMKWERVPGQASFRFNAAIQNSSDPHYAVAIGKAWWSSYEASMEIYFSDSPTGDGEGGDPIDPIDPIDPVDPSEPDGGDDDEVDNVQTGRGFPVAMAAVAVTAAGALLAVARRKRSCV